MREQGILAFYPILELINIKDEFIKDQDGGEIFLLINNFLNFSKYRMEEVPYLKIISRISSKSKMGGKGGGVS